MSLLHRVLRVSLPALGQDALADPPEPVHDANDAGEHIGALWRGPETQRSKQQGPLGSIPQTKMMKLQVWTWILERSGTFVKFIIFWFLI